MLKISELLFSAIILMLTKISKHQMILNNRIRQLERDNAEMRSLLRSGSVGDAAPAEDKIQFPVFFTIAEYEDTENHPKDMVSYFNCTVGYCMNLENFID